MRRKPGESQRPTFRRPLSRLKRGWGGRAPASTRLWARPRRPIGQNYFWKNLGETGPNFVFAPYGNWERINWREMTGITLRIFVDPVFGPFGPTRYQNLGKSWFSTFSRFPKARGCVQLAAFGENSFWKTIPQAKNMGNWKTVILHENCFF